MQADENEAADSSGYVSSAEAAQRVGVPYRTLMDWAEAGLLEPGRAGAGGVTSPLQWSAKHLREAGVIAALRARGVSLAGVRNVMDHLRAEGHNPLSTGQFLVMDHGGEVIKLCDSGEALSCLRSPGQRVLSFIVVDLTAAAETA